MLRELEGPDARHSDGAGEAAPPAKIASGRLRNLAFRAVAVVSATIVVVLGAMHLRAPAGDDKHAMLDSASPVQPPADSGRVKAG
jgi:hypothetical protein